MVKEQDQSKQNKLENSDEVDKEFNYIKSRTAFRNVLTANTEFLQFVAGHRKYELPPRKEIQGRSASRRLFERILYFVLVVKLDPSLAFVLQNPSASFVCTRLISKESVLRGFEKVGLHSKNRYSELS